MRQKKGTKIAILVPGLPPNVIGGTEIATEIIAKILAKRNFDVHIITRNTHIKFRGKTRSLNKKESNNGYIIHRTPHLKLPFFGFIIDVLFGLHTLIKIRPDIIHGQMIKTYGFIAVLGGKLLRKKTIVSARGSDFYNSSNIYLKSLGKFIVSQASIVLGVSNHMTRRMQEVWPQKPIFRLYNGVELERYFHDTTPKSTINLIFVGRLVKIKRVSDAIKAVSNLKKISPKLSLTIVGSGPRERFLKDLAHQLNIEDHIRYIGSIHPKEIPKTLSKADIFIFPSQSEGLPNVILEAMASSLPIIASRITAIPELVQDHLNGLLHAPENVRELTENLKKLIQNDNLRKSMGQKSREIAQKYNWDEIIDTLIKFYFNHKLN